jgi:hypothetical protein
MLIGSAGVAKAKRRTRASVSTAHKNRRWAVSSRSSQYLTWDALMMPTVELKL